MITVLVWICILNIDTNGVSMDHIDNLASYEDCKRIGDAWQGKNGLGDYGRFKSYRCIQVKKVVIR